MAVIQETKAKPRQNTVTIPQKDMRDLEWSKGDNVKTTADKEHDRLILTRVQDGEN